MESVRRTRPNAREATNAILFDYYNGTLWPLPSFWIDFQGQ
ncbi:MAG: hypothetical protein P8Q40_05015 [Candidatus Poseidonia sp.]|nr:hypothetical protein [Poseidonia sp.]MDG1552156.1 hypothetical protein [Poseidonia sp.]